MDKNTSTLQHFQKLNYLRGFGNTHQSQALPESLPKYQNSPQKLKYGLYPQQLNGTAFTVKRASNQKVWTYKLRPSAIEKQYSKSTQYHRIIASYLKQDNIINNPNQMRWKPIPDVPNNKKVDFVQGLVSILGAGQPSLKQGLAIYIYSINDSMNKKCFYNSDGDFLIVPQSGTLYITTLFGRLTVSPHQICTIQRGIKFTVQIKQNAKGWIAQNYRGHLQIPQLGPIGCNGMANPKDFQYPVAFFEDKKQEWTIINKYIGQIFEAKSNYSPYDVVAWRGNYIPYKYNLDLYNTLGSISYDHPDPSIFTVLTCGSHMEGTASLDFVIFPPRWLVAEHTFKPPFYHRNCMSEFMGNISGEYDAKSGKGFGEGCSSLHSIMTPHGPDTQSYKKGALCELKPDKVKQGNLSFMFESGFMLKITKFAFDDFLEIDKDYAKCWQGLEDLKIQQ